MHVFTFRGLRDSRYSPTYLERCNARLIVYSFWHRLHLPSFLKHNGKQTLNSY